MYVVIKIRINIILIKTRPMDHYTEWRQSKLYEGHINRMRIIHKGSPTHWSKHDVKLIKKKNTSPVKTIQNSSKNNHNNNNHKKSEVSFEKIADIKRKCYTSMNKTSKNQSQRKRLRTSVSNHESSQRIYLPNAFLSGQENSLIKNALSSKNLSVKQKEQLLENYLLSKRILSAKTALQTKHDEKAYLLHKKISFNLSRSQKISQAFSTERCQKFKKFEKQVFIKPLEIGKGKSFFNFHIKNILLIKGNLSKDPDALYRLTARIGKRHYQMQTLSFEDLFKKVIHLRFKKIHAEKTPQLFLTLSVFRSNSQQQIGHFQPKINHFENEGNSNKVYRVMRGKIPIGTIQISGEIKYHKKKQLESSDYEYENENENEYDNKNKNDNKSKNKNKYDHSNDNEQMGPIRPKTQFLVEKKKEQMQI